MQQKLFFIANTLAAGQGFGTRTYFEGHSAVSLLSAQFYSEWEAGGQVAHICHVI